METSTVVLIETHEYCQGNSHFERHATRPLLHLSHNNLPIPLSSCLYSTYLCSLTNPIDEPQSSTALTADTQAVLISSGEGSMVLSWTTQIACRKTANKPPFLLSIPIHSCSSYYWLHHTHHQRHSRLISGLLATERRSDRRC